MERTNRQMGSMMAAARERLNRHTPEQIAERAGAAWQNGVISLQTLGRAVMIRTAGWTVTPRLSPWHTLTLLHYLDLVDGTPPSGRLLLDERAPHCLTIEDAVTVGSLILDELTGVGKWGTQEEQQ